MSGAFLRRRDRTARTLRVGHYSSAVNSIREAWAGDEGDGPFDGPVEVDETYIGCLRQNKSNAKRAEARGRGPVDMTPVIAAKDRDTNRVVPIVVRNTDARTLHRFVDNKTDLGTVVCSDDAKVYEGILNPHETVKHSVRKYVKSMVHTNGIESFWSMLKRGHKGTFHKIFPKHLQCYASEFAGKQPRESDTLDQMRDMVA